MLKFWVILLLLLLLLWIVLLRIRRCVLVPIVVVLDGKWINGLLFEHLPA